MGHRWVNHCPRHKATPSAPRRTRFLSNGQRASPEANSGSGTKLGAGIRHRLKMWHTAGRGGFLRRDCTLDGLCQRGSHGQGARRRQVSAAFTWAPPLPLPHHHLQVLRPRQTVPSDTCDQKAGTCVSCSAGWAPGPRRKLQGPQPPRRKHGFQEARTALERASRWHTHSRFWQEAGRCQQ